MVLHDVAHAAGLVVEPAAALDAEALRHRDLHALDVLPIPQRLEERVGEAEEEQVLDGVLAQIVIDVEHAGFVEAAMHGRVQSARRGQILTERLLDHDASTGRAPRLAELIDDGLEEARRDGQVVRRVTRVPQLLAQALEGPRIGVIAVDVVQHADQASERVGIETAVPLDAVAGARLQLIARPAGLGDANHGDVEVAASGQRLESGKDLLVGEVAGGPEEHERVGLLVTHRSAPLVGLIFSWYSTAASRIARSASARPRMSPTVTGFCSSVL